MQMDLEYFGKKSAGLYGKWPRMTIWPILCLVFIGPVAGLSQSAHESLRQGDRQYDLENYKAAERYYRDAADRQMGDAKALYNLGNSFYQQGNWDDAAKRFEQAARNTDDPGFRADALHNYGNALLKQRKYKEAVQAYENSLRLRPGDAGAKQNLQMAKKKLKEEQQKQQQQQQRPQNQDNTSQEQQQQQPEDRQQQSPGEEQQQAQQNNAGQDQQQPSPQPEQQEQQQYSGNTDREEARRLLETAIGPEDRKNAKKYREQRRQPMPSGKEKDW
ncbi:MAG: tetratricopeptide repeat protein [Saprospiraceae bacterium]|nr:tetratricopeptide repeat protein [Saprospiraceae bacterium]